MRPQTPFRFKQFNVAHHQCAHKVGTDGVLLGAWTNASQPKQILDVGCGSGLIALMLAQRFPNAKITGIELDTPSAQQAQDNAQQSPFASQIEIKQGDFLKTAFAEYIDLIVSNPPFYKGNTSSGSTPRDRARHEEFLPAPLFIEKALSLLSPQGQIALILPTTEAKHWIQIAQSNGLYLLRKTSVLGSPSATAKRWLLQMGLQKQALQENALTLRNTQNQRSEAYTELTKEFYV